MQKPKMLLEIDCMAVTITVGIPKTDPWKTGILQNPNILDPPFSNALDFEWSSHRNSPTL